MPDGLPEESNGRILTFLECKGGHDGIVDVLQSSTANLGAVTLHCPNPMEFAYCVAIANEVIFAFAVGIQAIAYHLPPAFWEIAVRTGGAPVDGLNSEWFQFKPGDSSNPNPDFNFWATRAYLYARGEDVA